MPRRTDANQADIVQALRLAGCTVHSLHAVGHGCPDLLIGRGGENYLLEVKTDDGTLRWSQQQWIAKWRGQVAVVRSVEEALVVLGVLEEARDEQERI